MRYRILFLLGMIPFLAIGQNPLKKELKGNGTSMHYSPSQFSFTNQNGVTVYVADLKDRRSINWNKQVNDSVKIEAIGDFWNYPMTILFKNKINQDLTKANINVDYSAQGENIFKIDPVLDVLYPNFASYPEKGYWVLAKINMQVSKGSQMLFTKSYQEYTFFNKNINGYNEGYNTDLKEGANVAMWSSVKRLLDQFYKDLNSAFVGQPVSSSDVTLNTIGVSKIVSDPNLNHQVSNYSGSKISRDTLLSTNNYKIEGDVPLPNKPGNSKLDNAVNVLGSGSKIEINSKKPSPLPLIDSAKLAERKLREEMRKKAVDSARKAREEIALNAKKTEQQEKEKLQFKRDSVLQAKKAITAAKLRERFVSDSIKKAEINKKIDEAKALTKEKRNQLKKENSSENNISNPKNDEPAVEKKKPLSIAKRPSRKVANESISDAVRRIAQEVEEEELGITSSQQTSHSQAKIERKNSPKPDEIKNKRADEIAKAKAEREKVLAEMRMKKMQKDSLLSIEKQKKQDSLMAIRKAKAMEIEATMARAKSTKDSINKLLAAKKYVEDSIQLVKDKEKRREAVLAAQKAAIEAERNALLNNPSAGEMFASVSTDPPSKLPDSRTREQKLADRIFTPKSDNTKDLLARVKLITPEEEAKLLAQMKTDDKTIADSFFIQMQKNRPLPTYTPLDTVTTKNSTKKIEDPVKPVITKEDKKAQIIEKGLKGAKNLKETPLTKTSDISAVSKKILDTTVKTTASKNVTTKSKENLATPASIPTKSDPPRIQPPAIDSATAEQKAKDLEAEIERKKKEINERLKKAKQW